MPTKYIHKLESSIETKPGCWNYTLVGVYQQELDDKDQVVSETKIGEYQRNYHNKGPFYAFKLGDQWYALYSKEYMYTRVMSLPDCIDLCGEDKSNVEYKDHFCPVEYFVPEVCVQDFKPGEWEQDPSPYNPRHDPKTWAESKPSPMGTYYVWADDKDSNASEEFKQAFKDAKKKCDEEHRLWMDRHPFIEKYASFGFVAGASWGDDSSWKIQLLDLREVSKGVFKRTEAYGDLELPRNVKLKDAIDTEYIEARDLEDWSQATLYIAKPYRISVDGSYSSWWIDELFKGLDSKYKDKIPDSLRKELQEHFTFFFSRGLEDGNSSTEVLQRIKQLYATLANTSSLSMGKRVVWHSLRSKLLSKFTR